MNKEFREFSCKSRSGTYTGKASYKPKKLLKQCAKRDFAVILQSPRSLKPTTTAGSKGSLLLQLCLNHKFLRSVAYRRRRGIYTGGS